MKVHQTKKQEVIRLSVQGSEDLTVTPNHPFYAMRKVRYKKGIQTLVGPEWVSAGELTKDHLIAYGIDHPTLPDCFISETEAWAVGRWLADGSVDLKKSNPRIFLSIGIGKEELAREMLGRLPYAVYENKPHATATNFCFTSKEFYSLIVDAGIGAGNKRIPPYVFQLPRHLQRAVLDGYISGDGYIRVRDHGRELSACTASRELAYGISRLIRNVYHVAANISVRMQKNREIDGRDIRPNYPVYQITANLDSKMRQCHEENGIIWQPVRGIEKVAGRRTVYNLSVLEDNTYAANDVIVHNCGAFSSNGGDDFKAVLEAVIGVKEEGIEVPAPADHRWPKADVYLGDGFSVAYRVLDAQYWGVPQRRARIYLVADFDGGSAGEVLFKSEGMSGYTPQGFGAWEGTAGGVEKGAGEADGWPDAGSGDGRYCLNPQGCSGITLTEEQTGTLVAQDHGHHPAVLQSAGFSTEHSAQSRSIGYEEEKSPTLRAGVVPATMMFDNHAQEARYDGPLEQCPTVTARYGTGGNTQPLVAARDDGGKAYGIAKEAFNAGESAAFNFAVNEEVSPTLQAAGPGAVAKPEVKAFGVCSKGSNAMLSDNPHSGFYEAKTSRTLDCNGGRPENNQGGICIVAPAHENQTRSVYSLQGSMIGREDKNGPQGDGINEDVSFTLNTIDRHAVVAPVDYEHATYCATTGSFMTVDKEKTPPLMARDYKDPQVINDTEKPEEKEKAEPMYIVRRLTPVECARLQGFPDWWCSDLAIPDPNDEEVAFWAEVWETWRKLTNPNGKPKTEKQLRKWLAEPYTDAAEYKLWGNGVSLPIVYFVLSGIAWAATKTENKTLYAQRTL